MSTPRVTAVSIEALSYSGTTWLNLVIGSHPKAFTLGPPWRVWGLKDKGFEGANLVWGERDTFWRGFDKAWDRRGNFLIALADYANVTHIVFDNPSPEFRTEVMTHPEIAVRNLRYIRDGRAISASFARKNPQLPYLDTILPSGWLWHSFMGFGNSGIDAKNFSYEASLAAPETFLADAGAYVGLALETSHLRFWEKDHHITFGNPGTIAMLRHAKGLDDGAHEGRDFYRLQFERLKVDPLHGFGDERWKTFLTRADLAWFDLLMGEKNASLGYARDRFTSQEARALLSGAHERLADGGYPGEVAAYVDAYFAALDAGRMA